MQETAHSLFAHSGSTSGSAGGHKVDAITQPGKLTPDLAASASRKRTSAGRKRANSVWQYLDYEDIPDWMCDNDLIRHYYRPQMTFKQAALTLFAWHNETVNVWSHLIGFFVMVALSVWWLLEAAPVVLDANGVPCSQQGSPVQPKWPLLIFLLCIMYTDGASSFAHLFYVVSKQVNSWVWRIDHTGVSVGCTGAFFPICTYVFSCTNRFLAPLYIAITCAIGVPVVACSMMDVFHTPAFRPWRLAIQLSFAVWSQVPMIHAMVLMAPYPEPRLGLIMVYVAISLCVLGGAVFATRITEKLFTRRVDMIGSSHNIMHCMVVAGHVMLFFGGRKLWQWRSGPGACDAPVCDVFPLGAAAPSIIQCVDGAQ